MQCLDIADFLSFCRRCRQAKLIEAIRFKVEQRMEGARKDRHATKKPGFPGYYFIMGDLEHHWQSGAKDCTFVIQAV